MKTAVLFVLGTFAVAALATPHHYEVMQCRQETHGEVAAAFSILLNPATLEALTLNAVAPVQGTLLSYSVRTLANGSEERVGYSKAAPAEFVVTLKSKERDLRRPFGWRLVYDVVTNAANEQLTGYRRIEIRGAAGVATDRFVGLVTYTFPDPRTYRCKQSE